MELGRSAWIRRERLARIATAERDRRAGRTALAIAALGEASEWPARAVLALALLPDGEGRQARRILEEGLEQWVLESGLPSLDTPDEEPLTPAFEAFQIELDRPIEAGELERAFAEAEAQVDEMHDVNRVAERVLFEGAFELTDPADEELDPLEQSARRAAADRVRPAMDAASVPPASTRWDVEATSGRPSREIVLATLERWLQNLAHSGAEGMR